MIGVDRRRQDAGRDKTRRASRKNLILEHVFGLPIQFVNDLVDSGDLVLVGLSL